LKNAGVNVVEMDTLDYAQACADFYDAVVNGTLRYPSPQPELTAAVMDARTQPMGDAWKWSRKNSTSADITPLVAVTLAHWGSLNAESEYTSVIYAASEHEQEAPEPVRGPKTPRVISQAEQTTCFACSTGYCPRHGKEPR
jgi:hypothetical protein